VIGAEHPLLIGKQGLEQPQRRLGVPALAGPEGDVMPTPTTRTGTNRPNGLAYMIAALIAMPVGMLIRAQFPEGPSVFSRLPLDPDDRTAIYDIVAHTIYLPSGLRLEAHSGMGSYLDDPRYVDVRAQGPTPPNVYNLVLRERPFHGVRAIHLVPVDSTKMFGRMGLLAHTYMLGPSGQSNGCVAIRDYPLFLDAFLRGEVDRLIVV
jgi:hypothetical protein